MTFTSSPGNDALASGIRLEGIWVGRINRYTEEAEIQRQVGFFSLRESVTVGISADADV